MRRDGAVAPAAPDGTGAIGPGIGEARILVPPAAAGTVVHVRALVTHPMHTGFFRDAEGRPIAAHFIREVTVDYGGERVARFEWTSGVSRDPFVTFPLRVTKAAALTITWTDNLGGVYTQTAPVAVTA